MVRKISAVAIIGASVALCTPAYSQQPPATDAASVPEEAREKLANDLANLQGRIQAAQDEATKDAEQQRLAKAEQFQLPKKFVEVTRENSKVLSGADLGAPVEFSTKPGEKFLVLDQSNGFYAVTSPNGTTGWITSADVKPTVTGYELTPSVEWTKPGYKNWLMTSMPQSDNQSSPIVKAPTLTERVYKAMADAAISFKESYKDNPYFRVTGFTVVVSVPPALNLEFSFR